MYQQEKVLIRQRKKLISTEVENNDQFPPTSRYKNARYYRRDIPNVGQRIEPESWNPVEIPDEQKTLVTWVKGGEEGRLDAIADRVYRRQDLHWVLAYSNDIIDPIEEVVVNLKLIYPPIEWVLANLLA